MNEDTRPIIEGLLKKAREDKVAWVHASTIGRLNYEAPIDPADEDFAVNTSSFTINVFRITTVANETVKHGVRINIVNEQGNVIMTDIAYPGDNMYTALAELITLARKAITHEDEILKKIMDGLNKPGVFGSTDSNPATDDDDDVPF
jgi:pyruvate carboxylase